MSGNINKKKRWTQAAVVAILTIGAAAAFIRAETEPLSRDELKIAAANPRSFDSDGAQMFQPLGIEPQMPGTAALAPAFVFGKWGLILALAGIFFAFSGAARERLPELAEFLSRKIFGARRVRIPWSEVSVITDRIKLKSTAKELKLDERKGWVYEFISRLPRA